MKLSLCFLALLGALFIQTAISGIAQKQVMPADDIPPAEVTAYSSSRSMRLMHNLFHNIRMNFFLLDEIEQREIANLGWKPQYVSFTYINGDINQPVMIEGPTGEDFLFMHRRMINAVNEIAAAGTSGWSVEGWTACPPPGDAEWPVPEVPDEIQGGYREYLAYYKTDDFYNTMIKAKEDEMDDAYYQSLTLGEFGTLIEYELHTFFHVRFAAWNPVGYRIQHLHPTMRIDEKWDNPEYDYLADFYSAHVNPTFWKIHGWIETKIEAWCIANSIDPDNLVWTSTWEMGPMNTEILAALEKVADDAFYRRVSGNDDAKHITAAVLGGLLCCVLILLAGYMCMNKMMAKAAKNAGYAKANQQTTGI